MNLSAITRAVSDFVRDARNVEVREDSYKVYVLRCEIQGRIRTVQFDQGGLYGAGMYSTRPAISDLALAAQIAQELRK
jgi:hypothetical protein